MGNKPIRKFGEDHPDVIAVRKYDSEINRLEQKRKEANEARDWTMRNFYDAQLIAKRTNRDILVGKLKRTGIIFE